jgi:hypothetical protein
VLIDKRKELVNEMKQERFDFVVGGETPVGNLHLPDGSPNAAIVTTGPLTSVKEQATGAYARAMAERGFAALAFDHRYFGESGGQPRQFENPAAKVEDIRAAAAALAAERRTHHLPLAAVGVCAGGGYMARAVAEEPALRPFAGVAGVYSDASQTRAWFGDGFEEMIQRARDAEKRFEATGVAETIPAVAPDGVTSPCLCARHMSYTALLAAPSPTTSTGSRCNPTPIPCHSMPLSLRAGSKGRT